MGSKEEGSDDRLRYERLVLEETITPRRWRSETFQALALRLRE